MSISLQRYNDQKKEIDDLLTIHSVMRDNPGRGKSAANIQVLHKSSVVLLTACWESFVENILNDAIAVIAANLPDHSKLPLELQKSIASARSKNLTFNATHELYPWFFAGDNWRTILLQFAQLKISELNTPNSENTKNIFSLLLGISDITQSWGRKGLNASDAADKLDNHLSDRHTIAHGAEIVSRITKGYIVNYREFLDRTVEKTDTTVRNALLTLNLTLP